MLCSLFPHDIFSKHLFSQRLPRLFNLDLKLLLFEQAFWFIPQRRLHLIRHLGHQLGLLIQSLMWPFAFPLSSLKSLPTNMLSWRLQRNQFVYFIFLSIYSLWSVSVIIGICSTTIIITTPPHFCVAPGLELAVFPPQPGVLWLQLWATVYCPCWRCEFASAASGNEGN